MALVKIQVNPGVDREGTSYSAQGRWFECDKIRFVSGNPEKLNGWQRVSDATYLGVARSLINWTTLQDESYVGIGTNLKYYLERGGSYFDITPIRKITDPMPENPFILYSGKIKSDITEDEYDIEIDSGFFPASGGIIRIGDEIMRYGSFDNGTLMGVERGYAGTKATEHKALDTIDCAMIGVYEPNHGAYENDFVTFSESTDVAGIASILINAEHEIYGVESTDKYTIYIDRFTATPTTGGGSSVKSEHQVNTGLDVYQAGLGWGTDPWGAGGWGSPGSVGLGQQLRLWSHANYGEDLIFNQRNGSIFYWDATKGPSERGIYLSNLATDSGYEGKFVPHTSSMVITTPTERFVTALGANSYNPFDENTEFDPLLVRWSDQDNPFDWVPAITNQSGEFRLSHGSYIVGSVSTRQETLIWTDAALYSMQYVGADYAWGFNLLTDNISCMSPQSMTTANNMVFWMGKDKFYVYTGRVETLPCTLRQYIFSDINKDQAYQVFAGTNESYSEVWWFYCSRESDVVDKYVVFNYLEKVWYYGTLKRSAWLDSPVRQYPIAASYHNCLIEHEFGTDDNETAQTKPIHAYIQSADVEIEQGNELVFVWRILPDVNFTGSQIDKPYVKVSLRPRRNAGAAFRPTEEPKVQSKDDYRDVRQYTVQQFDGQVYTRLRARQMALRIESNEIGVAWELGSFRADVVADGTR